jgi:hypothetical protein
MSKSRYNRSSRVQKFESDAPGQDSSLPQPAKRQHQLPCGCCTISIQWHLHLRMLR